MDTDRKGARSLALIPPEILEKLNNGEIATVNLMEWLAIDQRLLLKNTLNLFQRSQYYNTVIDKIENLKKPTINLVNETIGSELYSLSHKAGDGDFFHMLSNHPADSVRCWACYFVSLAYQDNLQLLFENITPFAADAHFGVREIAWLSVRKYIVNEPQKSIDILSKWTRNSNPNIRRFASEATRPRGVWCAHIDVLKQKPELGLPILEPLKNDSSKYVQDSVGNWLNDASKTTPDFVRSLAEQWNVESQTKETKYIIKRALRSIT